MATGILTEAICDRQLGCENCLREFRIARVSLPGMRPVSRGGSLRKYLAIVPFCVSILRNRANVIERPNEIADYKIRRTLINEAFNDRAIAVAYKHSHTSGAIIRSSRQPSVPIIYLRLRLGGLQEFANDIAEFQKVAICARLVEVEIDTKRFALLTVGAGGRGSHHDNTHGSAALTPAKPGQHFKPICLWNIEVQQQNLGAGDRSFFDLFEEPQCGLAISHEV